MENENIFSKVSPTLFWDVNLNTLSWDKHILLIIERVITRGTYKEFKNTEQHYGKMKMGEIAKQIKKMPDKDMEFVHVHFGIPLIELKCYSKKQ